MIAFLVLLVSTGCRTAARSDSDPFAQTLALMIPQLPEVPTWPEVTWIWSDGLYCLTEEDVDKVLDYLENQMPLYRFEMDQYEGATAAVIEALLR